MDDRSMASYNHGDALLAYLQQLHQQQRFVDVSMQCGGELLAAAHRLVLAAFSQHFETALGGVDGSSTITLDVDPKITGVSAADLKAVLEFMYTGRAEAMGDLVSSAQALGCVSLVNLLQSDEAMSGAMVEDAAHAQRLLDAVRRFYIDDRFTDVTINCQGVPLSSCHRLILCAYSDHFEAALASTENCPLVTLDIDSAITGVTSLDLRTIVDFMYSGVLRVAKRRVKSLTAAARALGVAKLVEVLTVGEQQRLLPAMVDGAMYASTVAASVEPIPSGGEHVGYADQLCHDSDFDVDAVGATEDVGSAIDDDAANEVMGPLLTDSYPTDEPSGRELTAADDYVDIYEEYVAGPRRGRRGGSYGRKPQQLCIKGPAQRMPDGEDDMSLFGADMASSSDGSLPMAAGGDGPFAAVTMSFTPSGKRRRVTDSYGYGLPEISGTNDVTVPLIVGDQEAMMEKPFKCPYCDHRTKEKSAVEKHIRCIHTLEAPYKCRYCNQAFKVQSNLVRHIRAHTGEKPYVCKKCGAAYADKKNMDAHVFREHLKMKPLECPAPGCTAKFWRQDRFNYHCRRQHAFEPAMEEGV